MDDIYDKNISIDDLYLIYCKKDSLLGNIISI